MGKTKLKNPGIPSPVPGTEHIPSSGKFQTGASQGNFPIKGKAVPPARFNTKGFKAVGFINKSGGK